jgi:hypothetical protein
MKFQTELMRRPDPSDAQYRVIAQGEVDVSDIKRLLHLIGETTQPLPGCGSLVDLRDVTCQLHPIDLHDLLHQLKPNLLPRSNRIAFVSPPEIEEYDQLYMLSVCLWGRGLKVDVFYDIDSAAEWLRNELPVSTEKGNWARFRR